MVSFKLALSLSSVEYIILNVIHVDFKKNYTHHFYAILAVVSNSTYAA